MATKARQARCLLGAGWLGVAIVVACAAGPKVPDVVARSGGPCNTARVVDGDTADLACESETVRVRLLNVDTPERGEDGFGEAKTSLEEMLVGREVRLEFERPKRPEFDKYDRLLVYVMDERGKNVNVEMVRAGKSCFYRRFGKGRYRAEFERAEEEAAAEGRRIPPCV